MIETTDRSIHSRRAFLGSAAAVAALATMPVVVRADAPRTAAASSSSSFTDFQRRLLGPIYSNPCPFTADLKPDDAGQRKAISRALKHGIGVFAATGGNTQYSTLSFDEIKQVNRIMIEAVGRRALVIAATGDWSTEQAASFAKFAEELGADGVQVQLPKAVAKDEDGAVKHYEGVAKATKLPLVLHGTYSDALLRRLVGIESIAAMKQDQTLDDYIRQYIDLGNRLVIFGGGGEHRHYVGWPYGAQAYYSTYSTFAPDISAKTWKLIQYGDIKQAAALTAKYDYPFIRRFSHGLWHAALELFGISTRHVRVPHEVFTDEEMNELKQWFIARGVSPESYKD